jgi:arylamine N-acetyltransferase
MAAHARELFRGAVLLEEAETQTDDITDTGANTQTTPAPATVDASTQATPRTDETASQTNDNPKRRYAALQTEPPNDEPTQL